MNMSIAYPNYSVNTCIIWDDNYITLYRDLITYKFLLYINSPHRFCNKFYVMFWSKFYEVKIGWEGLARDFLIRSFSMQAAA